MGFFWLMVGIAAAYLVVLTIAYAVLAGKRRFLDPWRLWPRS